MKNIFILIILVLFLTGCIKVEDEDIILDSGLEYHLEVHSVDKGLGGICLVDGCTLEYKDEVDSTTVGVYVVTYDAVVKEEVKHTIEQRVIVLDTTPSVPEEYESITVEAGAEFIDPGIMFYDNYDAERVVYTLDSVETKFVGEQIITYIAEDSSGNKTVVERVVNLVDTTGPIIYLNGVEDITLEAGEDYKELAGVVSDNYDDEVSLEITGEVDNDTVGTYYIYYDAIDSNGNEALKLTRTIHIVDTTPPTFDVIENQRIQVGTEDIDWTSYIENSSDNSDSELTFMELDTINYYGLGVQPVTVRVEDAEGNYMDQTFDVYVASDAVYDYGIEFLKTRENAEKYVDLYYDIVQLSDAFFMNADDLEFTQNHYAFGEVDTTDFIYTTDDIIEVLVMVEQDHPEYYWLESFYYYTQEEEVVKISLYVDEFYATYNNRAYTQKAISDMSKQVLDRVSPQMSDLRKVQIVYDYILGRTDYSYESDGETPKVTYYTGNIDGVASRYDVVCEGYTRTFKYLLDLVGIDNIAVTGTVPTGEGHTWNIAKIDDEYYYFELTWQDGYPVDYYFFGETSSFMDSEHIPDSPEGSTWDFLYPLPDISNTPIKP